MPDTYIRPEVMLDVETLGKRPGCVVLSIGLVQFAGEPVSWLHGCYPYYREINLQGSMALGLTVDPDTLAWWLKQDIKPPVGGVTGPDVILRELNDRINDETLVWANSPNFDCTILEAVYDRCGITPSWSYRNLRCLRTALDILPEVPAGEVPTEPDNVAHNALSDAKWQARRLMLARERAKRTDWT